MHLFNHELAQLVDVINEHVIGKLFFILAVDVVGHVWIHRLLVLVWANVVRLVPEDSALASTTVAEEELEELLVELLNELANSLVLSQTVVLLELLLVISLNELWETFAWMDVFVHLHEDFFGNLNLYGLLRCIAL